MCVCVGGVCGVCVCAVCVCVCVCVWVLNGVGFWLYE